MIDITRIYPTRISIESSRDHICNGYIPFSIAYDDSEYILLKNVYYISYTHKYVDKHDSSSYRELCKNYIVITPAMQYAFSFLVDKIIQHIRDKGYMKSHNIYRRINRPNPADTSCITYHEVVPLGLKYYKYVGFKKKCLYANIILDPMVYIKDKRITIRLCIRHYTKSEVHTMCSTIPRVYCDIHILCL